MKNKVCKKVTIEPIDHLLISLDKPSCSLLVENCIFGL